jgi:hypothetical protein
MRPLIIYLSNSHSRKPTLAVLFFAEKRLQLGVYVEEFRAVLVTG